MKKFCKFVFCSLILVLMFSCQTFSQKKTLPDWVLKTPNSDSKYEYFTASGTDLTPAEAEKKAIANLISQAMQYLGTSIQSSSQAVVTGETASLKRFIESELTQNSKSNLELFKISEKFFSKDETGTTVYVLGCYDKTAMTKERLRLEKIFQEKLASFQKPEHIGDELFASKDYFYAGKNFILAASNAVLNEVDNAQVHFNRNIEKAKSAFEKIKIDASQNDDKATNQLFIKSNTVQLPVKIIFFGDRLKKNLEQENVILKSEYNFQIPVGTFLDKIYIYLDDTNLFDSLNACGKHGQKAKTDLEKIILSKQKIHKLTQSKDEQTQSTISFALQLNATSDMPTEFLQALKAMLLKKGYTVKTRGADYTLLADLKLQTSTQDKETFFENFTVNFTVYKNSELVQAETLQKSSLGFSKLEARQGVPKIAAEALVKVLALK